jgi:hypothetical protein
MTDVVVRLGKTDNRKDAIQGSFVVPFLLGKNGHERRDPLYIFRRFALGAV